jgi:hypothetical protein
MHKHAQRISEETLTSCIEGSIQTMCLMIDDATHNGVTRTIISVLQKLLSGLRNLKTLGVVPTVSKVATEAAKQVMDAVRTVLGDYQRVITSGVTDGFTAARNTMMEVLKSIDEDAVKALPGLCDLPKYISCTETAGLQFRLDVPIRQLRLRTCMMHGYECVYKHFFAAVLQKKGLGKHGYTAQNIFSIHYYMKYLKKEWHAICMAAMGGDKNRLHSEIKECTNILGKICESRWLSQERVCFQLVGLMDVAASEALILLVRDFFGEESDTWQTILKCGRCFTKDNLSHMYLFFAYMVHHSADTTKKALWIIQVFLSCPIHRIAVRLGACMYTDHTKFAEFVDGKCIMEATGRTISDRLVEIIPFERAFVQKVTNTTRDFWGKYPECRAFLESEASRCNKEEFDMTRTECITYFEQTVANNTEAMQSAAEKYFRDQSMTIGWLPLHFMDANTGPHTAVCFLTKLHQANVPGSLVDERKYVHEPHLYTDAPQGVWDVNSTTHAWPGMTWKTFRAKVDETLSHSQHFHAIIKAYGLDHPVIVKELNLRAEVVYHLAL